MQYTKMMMVVGAMTFSSLALAGCSDSDQRRAQDTTNDAVEEVKEAGKSAAEYSRDAADKAGDYMSDAAITARVKAALADADQVSAFDINVETINGEVVLSGIVATDAEQDLAEQLAEAVDGVESVSNDIEVRRN